MTDITFSNRAPDFVTWTPSSSSFGLLLLGFTPSKELCRLAFLGKRKASAVLKNWQGQWPQTQFAQNAKEQKLKPETPILLVGTDFQHRVWSALLDIPAGETVTYGELAARIGKPKAARAVGTALGANPIPLLIPCHRVVASTGLGGFTGGLPLKKALLQSETHPTQQKGCKTIPNRL
ncbi:MAG: methylated-DNA--[protein]-cysteine S-methyltransferase [Alphaproteobacteria bacterium]|nr:methylated-DNA--[protein]-cysteine S-methyltransferase [Alphaproteobacteria bacterium]